MRCRAAAVSGLAMIMVGLCHCGGILLPGSASVAPGSTPAAVRVQREVFGSPRVVRERAAHVLADSTFRLSDIRNGAVDAYSLTRFMKVHIEVLPARDTKDSSVIAVSGEIYVGDATRRDTVSALPESWRLIVASDGAANWLHILARVIETSLGADASLPVVPLSVHHPDSSERARMAETTPGKMADFCAPMAVPPGWLAIYWFTDASRCTAGERPYLNVLRAERQY